MIHDNMSLIEVSRYLTAIQRYIHAGVPMVIFLHRVHDSVTAAGSGSPCSYWTSWPPVVALPTWSAPGNPQNRGPGIPGIPGSAVTSLTCHPEIGVFLRKNSLKLGICLRIRKFYLITSGRLYITISNSEYTIINISIFISRYIQYFIVNF